MITTSPDGGFDRLSKERKRTVKILAGVEYTRRGVPRYNRKYLVQKNIR